MAKLIVNGKRVSKKKQAGLTLLGLLFLVAGLGIGLAATGTLWSTVVKREKERELLFIGSQYRRAIKSFWEVPLPAGTPRRLPRDINELLSDRRFPYTVRHLRRIYRDPMTGNAEWGMVRQPDGGISGLHSLSNDTPMKTGGFGGEYSEFAGRTAYSDWIFGFKPPVQSPVQSGSKEIKETETQRSGSGIKKAESTQP